MGGKKPKIRDATYERVFSKNIKIRTEKLKKAVFVAFYRKNNIDFAFGCL